MTTMPSRQRESARDTESLTCRRFERCSIQRRLVPRCFTVHSVLRGPPPLAVSVTLLFAYLTLLGGSIFCLRWRVFVDAVIAGPRDSRGVALTFDDGPDEETTRTVLDTLDKYKATATFFHRRRESGEASGAGARAGRAGT